jgi:predicted RNA polymerase sigma factor
MVRDVGRAEELAQDALVAALEQWPKAGVPQNPGAWLMATAKHRALDHLRRNKMLERKHEELGYELQSQRETEAGEDLLSLIFTACHPVVSPEARVALRLRLLGGLPPARLRARSFFRRQRLRSGSSAPSGLSPTSRSRSKCPRAPN